MILSESTSCAISDTLQDIPEVCIPIRAVAAGFEAADLNRCGGANPERWIAECIVECQWCLAAEVESQ
jgi:hypothetical protein